MGSNLIGIGAALRWKQERAQDHDDRDRSINLQFGMLERGCELSADAVDCVQNVRAVHVPRPFLTLLMRGEAGEYVTASQRRL